MTSHRYTYILAALVIGTVGCIKKDSIRYMTLPAKTAEQVELLPGPPDKPFKVVGHVFIDGSNKRGWQSIAEAAREEAADMGADAVFMGDMGQYESGTMTMPGASTSTTTGTLRSSSPTRIRFQAPLSRQGLIESSSALLPSCIKIHEWTEVSIALFHSHSCSHDATDRRLRDHVD